MGGISLHELHVIMFAHDQHKISSKQLANGLFCNCKKLMIDHDGQEKEIEGSLIRTTPIEW